MHHWLLIKIIARENLDSQANYEFMFILSDIKNGKAGVDLTIMDKKTE